MGMQVVRSNEKTNEVRNFIRNTLWTRNTIRIVVQTFCATITVASFILILIMSLKPPVTVIKPGPSRCVVQSCRVLCNEAPLYDKYEEDIISAIIEAEILCQRLTLELYSPIFVNKTLPLTWLSGVRSYINHMTIIKGNLEHIPYGSFMSNYARNVQTLELAGLELKSWHPHGLVGLSNLRTLNIISSSILMGKANFLEPVDDTLETLVISHSGQWNPANVTGSKLLSNLVVVDFSYNNFGDILGADSFVGLKKCKILYLHSCKITAIGAGAFDNLISIEVLYLNNNKLKVVPAGLFATIAPITNPKPRINLQNNNWRCDCDATDLRELIRKDLLLIDAICLHPIEMEYKTFTEFEYFCVNGQFPVEEDDLLINGNATIASSATGLGNNTHSFDGSCCKENTTEESKIVRVIGVNIGNRCTSAKLSSSLEKYDSFEEQISNVRLLFEFTFVYESQSYTVLQIDALKPKEHGLIWFDIKCPKEAYCVDEVPKFLKIYNMKKNTTYKFCALDLHSGDIDLNKCVNYESDNKANAEKPGRRKTGISTIAYTITIILCLCFGASLVYALVRVNPILIKGNKRIIFVKHKQVDAIVMPPTLPIRNNDVYNNKDIDINSVFTVSKFNNLAGEEFNFNRQKSVRSEKSAAPSYVSALQPTEDQLAEWRIKHHFNNDLSLSTKSQYSTLSYYVSEAPYCSLDESDSTYESIK